MFHADNLVHSLSLMSSDEPKPLKEADETSLIAQIKGGDRAAASETVARYHACIYSKAYRLLHDRQDAEKVTQDALHNSPRGLGTFLGDSSFSTWLHRIVTNLARNRYHCWLRRRKDRTISLEEPISPESKTTLGELIHAEADSAYATVEAEDLSERVLVGMKLISSAHREILILKGIRGASYEEIAGTLNITVGTVKSRIARARESLRAVVFG